MKFVFPAVWIGGFAFATLAMFWSSSSLHESNGEFADPGAKWLFLLMTCAGAAFIWWTCIRLKCVRMDNQALYISNYSKEIVVRLSDVAGVSETVWINIHPVTIHFRSETAFGSQIVFMPESRWFGFWSSHPVVDEIQNAVARAGGVGPVV